MIRTLQRPSWYVLMLLLGCALGFTVYTHVNIKTETQTEPVPAYTILT